MKNQKLITLAFLCIKYTGLKIPRDQIKIVKGDKRAIAGWVMYDWSNSVYQLTIASTIFPIYYNAVTRHGNDFTVSFFGYTVINILLWRLVLPYFHQ